MKSTYFSVLPVFLLAASIVGCNKTELPDDSHRLEFSSLKGCKEFSLENSAQEYKRESDVTYRDSASIVMPEILYGFDIAALRDSIMKTAFDTIAANPAEAMNAYFANAVDELGYTAIEIPDSVITEDIDGFSFVQGNVYSLTTERLTYRITTDTYIPGAAHGMTTSYYITYDLTEGDIITLNDLFTPEGLEKLPNLISTRAKALKSQLGPTSIDALPDEGNFYVSLDEEIVFVYQPYEVASYAQGLICVPFYPYQLSECLSDRGLSFFGLNQ